LNWGRRLSSNEHLIQFEPLTRLELDETLRDYVCSTCWGTLTFIHVDGQWYAICPECKENTTGYTSKKFTERKKLENEQEYLEAAHNLRDVLGLKPEPQSKEKNLSDLGF
jgi:hypothetical protein